MIVVSIVHHLMGPIILATKKKITIDFSLLWNTLVIMKLFILILNKSFDRLMK